MKARLLTLALALTCAVGCSLLLSFTPEGQPCNADGSCRDGYHCVAGKDGAAAFCTETVCDEACADNAECVLIDKTAARGNCLPKDCQGIDCAEGALCENGRCVAKNCVGVKCGPGELCARGVCQQTSCNGAACTAGSVCFADAGACIDARCEGLSCNNGNVCLGGTCSGCGTSELSCDNGVDDDCDGKTDCEDEECLSKSCNDGKLCTSGETCGADRTCGGGTPTQCTGNIAGGCQTTSGTCVEGVGCQTSNAQEGTACDAGLCSTGATCDGKGTCRGTPKSCADVPPPSVCFTGTNQCDPMTGECGFTPVPADTVSCDDKNNCTVDDKCDGMGGCKGKPMVCNAGPCETSICENGACKTTPKADGTKCGSAPGERCCAAKCVDISNDALNCGSCGMKCSGPIAASNTPAARCLPITSTASTASLGAVSGRCECNAVIHGNNQCTRAGNPGDFVCRDAFPGRPVGSDDPEDNYCIPYISPPGRSCNPGQVARFGPSRDGQACSANNCAAFCSWP